MKNWEDLSVQERSDLIRVAIDNGITRLSDIKSKYNEFAGGGKKKPISPSAKKAMQYFINKGLTDYQAAGLVGNLMRESNFNPYTYNASSGAYGLAQWLGPRKAALFKRYGNNPTFDQQLDYIWYELNNTHTNGLKHLRNSRSALEAARNAMGYYEFSAGPEGAVADMIKHKQDGRGAMAKGIRFAGDLIGETYDYPIMPQGNYYKMPMMADYNNQTAYQPKIVYANPALNGYIQPSPVVKEIEQPIIKAADNYAVEEDERRDSLNKFGLLMGMLNGSRRQKLNSVPTTSTKYMNLLINSFDNGGPLKKLVKSVNARSNADFVQRAKDPNRRYIQDWKEKSKIATHKLSWAQDGDKAIVYPEVQNINGELHDFTNPKYNHGRWDALDSAIERGDTLMMSPAEAELFTKNYKRYYPNFFDEGGKIGDNDVDIGVLPTVTVTADLSNKGRKNLYNNWNYNDWSYYNPFDGNYWGIDRTGKKRNFGQYYPEGTVIVRDPKKFEQLRSNQVKINDANGWATLGNKVQGLEAALVLGAVNPLASVAGLVGGAEGGEIGRAVGGPTGELIGSIAGSLLLGGAGELASPTPTLGSTINRGSSYASRANAVAKGFSRNIRKHPLLADTFAGTSLQILPNDYLTIKPNVRTRVGDVEIDNPNLFYRVGTKEIVDDFNKTGIVRAGEKNSQTGINFVTSSGRSFTFKKDTYNNPMFKEGGLWYQPSEELNGLLVSNGRMQYAGKNSNPISYDSFGRRIPAEELNSSNTSAYMWEPGYGYRRVFAKETPTAEWPTSRVAPRITPENAASITPEQWTAAQDVAIARGDMTEAQRLRDLHFKVSAPNTKVVTEEGMPLSVEHGTVGNKYIKPFYEFSYEKARPGVYGKGFYFSRKVKPEYNKGRVIKSYLNMENPQTDVVGTSLNNGIMDDVGEYFVARKPNQIKLADAITYDDKGVRIPLGERDNFKINDIRYSWLAPFLGLGILGTSAQKKYGGNLFDKGGLFDDYGGKPKYRGRSAVERNVKTPNGTQRKFVPAYLLENPDVLEDNPFVKGILEQRPGSKRQYAKYFATALSAPPIINNINTNEAK